MNTDNVLEQYRREIINQTVQDLLEKFTSMVNTSLAVLNGRKVNPDEWEEVRGEPKPKKVIVKMATRKKRARKSCPVKGCKNVFAPRFGGFCNDHRGTTEFKAWAKGKKPVKISSKKAAKKR